MARWGLGKWIASWAVGSLAKVMPSFTSAWEKLSSWGIKVEQSFVASLWRQTERADYLIDNKLPTDLHSKVPIENMIEGELARPRQYMVTFDVTTYRYDYNDQGKLVSKIEVERRNIYFNKLMSPDEYRSMYMRDMQEKSDSETSVLDASFLFITHNIKYKSY